MIRKRMAKKDDKHILQIIRTELFPYAQKIVPSLQWNKYEMIRRLNDGKVFVSTTNGLLAGFVLTKTNRQTKQLQVNMLAVHKNRQRLGIGRNLLSHAEKVGKRYDCKQSLLYVNRSNERAIRFYIKQGYRPQQYDHLLDCYMMYKALM